MELIEDQMQWSDKLITSGSFLLQKILHLSYFHLMEMYCGLYECVNSQ